MIPSASFEGKLFCFSSNFFDSSSALFSVLAFIVLLYFGTSKSAQLRARPWWAVRHKFFCYLWPRRSWTTLSWASPPAGFTSGVREELPAVMHLFLPPPVGDEDFCVGDKFIVYDANGEMPLLFCIRLLESV